MEEKIKKLLVTNWLDDDTAPYLDMALSRIEKQELVRKVVCHEICLDEENLFGEIDRTLAYINKIKADGYGRITQKWFGYEDNYFVAEKDELEDDIEYCIRLRGLICNEVDSILSEKSKDTLDEFTHNIRNLITDKLTTKTKGLDGSEILSTVFIDDKTAKDIANGILFYVGKEAMKNPDREIPEL